MKYLFFFCFILSTRIFSQADCSDSRLDAVKDGNIEITGFVHTFAYGNYNKTYNSYRAIFINYNRADDSDFKEMKGDEIKVVIMIFSGDQSKLVPGTYTIQPNGSADHRSIAVGIYTAKGTTFAASYNNEYIGSVEIFELSDKSLCGKIAVKDSKGMEVTGRFNVNNEPVN
ncbi:MAG: hypothetical protein IAE93_05065 [Ignavibacteria bacterium]|nr:hypothetical protein [Ignavibacteria bacterium]